MNAAEKLKRTNSFRWWKEVISLGGLKFNQAWVHERQTNINTHNYDL